jgi:tetratricopeptide (TPR) repeat protein
LLVNPYICRTMYISPAQRQRLYRDFKSIDPRDPYSVIRFYEQHEDALATLELDSYLDCTLSYVNALSEAEEFQRQVAMCDFLIEFVMQESIVLFGGEDVFCSLLQKKGTALFALGQYDEAAKVLRSLVRIVPNHASAQALLAQCLQQEMPRHRLRWRGYGLLLLLLSAISAGVSGLVIQPFYPDWKSTASIFTVLLFVSGGVSYLYAEFSHYSLCRQTVRSWANAKSKHERIDQKMG